MVVAQWLDRWFDRFIAWVDAKSWRALLFVLVLALVVVYVLPRSV